MLNKFNNFKSKAEMYYIYHSIQRYIVSLENKNNYLIKKYKIIIILNILIIFNNLFLTYLSWCPSNYSLIYNHRIINKLLFMLQNEPFTSYTADALFNMARFLLHCMYGTQVPVGISKVYPL